MERTIHSHIPSMWGAASGLKAEYMVNYRPLTHVSADLNDGEAITPNRFLLLRPGGKGS